MKILLFSLLFSLNLFSQDKVTIKGKLFFSSDFFNTFTNLLVRIDSSSNYVQIKEDGIFEIKTSTLKKNYKLVFSYGNIKFKEYDYKFEWTKRHRPKSISLTEKCKINKSLASQDYKEKKLKLYFVNKNEEIKLTKRDKRIQRKAMLKYKRVAFQDIKNYDCYLNYNQRAFLYFQLTKNRKYLEKLRKDIIGYNYRYNRE